MNPAEFATSGMVEAHRGLTNQRFGETESFAHCEQTMREYEVMLAHELASKRKVLEATTGPDDCNHAQFGAFILAAPNVPALGRLTGARLFDMSPTLLEVGGYEIPESFQGHSLSGRTLAQAGGNGTTAEGEEITRQRLSGLGYI